MPPRQKHLVTAVVDYSSNSIGLTVCVHLIHTTPARKLFGQFVAGSGERDDTIDAEVRLLGYFAGRFVTLAVLLILDKLLRTRLTEGWKIAFLHPVPPVLESPPSVFLSALPRT
jgi:hypothetical protein